MSTQKKRLSISIDEKQYEQLQLVAEKADAPKAYIVRRAIANMLERVSSMSPDQLSLFLTTNSEK